LRSNARREAKCDARGATLHGKFSRRRSAARKTPCSRLLVSLSPVTAEQIEATRSYWKIETDPLACDGDTSSHAVQALDAWGLTYRAPLTAGVTVCRLQADEPWLDGIDIMFKGGQMGDVDVLERLIEG